MWWKASLRQGLDKAVAMQKIFLTFCIPPASFFLLSSYSLPFAYPKPPLKSGLLLSLPGVGLLLPLPGVVLIGLVLPLPGVVFTGLVLPLPGVVFTGLVFIGLLL